LTAPESAPASEEAELPPLASQSFIREDAPAAPSPRAFRGAAPKPEPLFLDEDNADGDLDALDLGAVAQRLDPEPAARPAAPAPGGARPAAGGTLFERMSLLARGGARDAAEAPEEKGEFDVPRFLNRQNNQ
jgi:hypothetical protein